MPANDRPTGPDRSKEHKKVTEDDPLKNVSPHNKHKEEEQKRAAEDVPEQTPIDEEELAGDEPLSEDL
ncbi:hypothetical protein [Chitinophaga sp. HK235]|uniref:hypothetical protein n=1 Tax=Chitinophaga sp. HK235 TaxID=2952571 RepID=UPI001BA65302|nr:hypothetical protein [Chitinophaga sp. HK235]